MGNPVAAVALLALATGLGGSVHVARAPTPSAQPDCVSLREMGVDGVTTGQVAGDGEVGRAEFQLPTGAGQGPKRWYLVHLHARVTVGGSGGTAILTAAANGKTGAQIQFRPAGSGVDWSTVSASEPPRQERSSTRTVEFRFANFLPLDSVHGGTNRLTFGAELFDGATFDGIQLFGDTCLETTDRSPEMLRAETQLRPETVHVGDSFTLRVRVRNVGSGAIGRVTVTARPDAGLTPVGQTTLTVDNLTGEWSGDLRFTARADGEHKVRLDLGTAISRYVGGDEVAVRVLPSRHGGTNWPIFAGVAIGAYVLFLVLRITHRRRRRPRSSRDA